LLKNVRSWKHLLTMVKINIIKYMRNPWLCSHTSCQTIDVDSTLIVWLMLQNGFIHENFCHIQNCVWSIFLWFSNSYFSGSGAHILFKDFMENFVSRVLFYHHIYFYASCLSSVGQNSAIQFVQNFGYNQLSSLKMYLSVEVYCEKKLF